MKPKLIFIGAISGFAATCLCAQEIRVATERGPYYVGVGVLLRVAVSGFEESPQPECQIEGDLPDSLRISLVGVSPQVSESMTIINGRVSRTRHVAFHFNYQVLAASAGRYTVGPFRVTQNGKSATAEAATFDFRDVNVDSEMRIQLELPSHRIYVGQRVPVTVRWAYPEASYDLIQELSIRSPLFDQFSFAPDAQSRQSMRIETAKGEIMLPVQVERRSQDGQSYIVYTGTRTLIADRPGTYHLQPITAHIRKAARGVRSRDPFDDLFGAFGSRRSVATEPLQAQGEPLDLEILPLPTAGRPASFAGAVGRGFRLEVSCETSFVRVGDPIPLRVVLSGNGNLEEAGLPPLASGGLDPARFRLPQGEPTGEVRDNQKQFSVTVRVLDANVDQIPSLEYAWFDPFQEKYLTTRSDPIALNVQDATIVSSADVVSQTPATAPRAQRNDSAPPADGAGSVPATVSLSGADLAIQLQPQQLLRRSKWWLGGATTVGPYVLGLGMIALALIDRRRRQIDPEVAQRRHNIRSRKSQIRQAASLPGPAAAKQIANALRQLASDAAVADRREVDELLAELETYIYAPNGTATGSLPEELSRRITALAEKISA